MIHNAIRVAPLLVCLSLTACGNQSVCEQMETYNAECGYEAKKSSSSTTGNTTGFGVCSDNGCDDDDLFAWDTYYTCLDEQADKCSIDALIACGGAITNISGECWLSLGGVSSSTTTNSR